MTAHQPDSSRDGSRQADRFLILAFLAIIVAPGVGLLFGVDREAIQGENRTLASFPSIGHTWMSVREFPDRFTRYFEDNFAFRPRLVRWQAAFRLKALDVSPSPAVIKGRDGWLFYAEDGAMEDYAEAPPLTGEQLEIWRRTLQDTTDWLRARGITYLFVISPDKHRVYSEFMPQSIRPRPGSRTDQLVTYLRERSTVPVLDLRPALFEAKTRERLYHRTDTHWNDRGAFVAYQQIVGALERTVPALRPATRAMFYARDVRRAGLDLAGMLGLTNSLNEDDLTLVPRQPRAAQVIEPLHPNPRWTDARVVTEVPDPRRPRAVIFRDSFGSGLIPFLSEDFSRVVYLWQYNVDPDLIMRERPDVVIQEWVGRRLTTLLPYDPVPGTSAASVPEE